MRSAIQLFDRNIKMNSADKARKHFVQNTYIKFQELKTKKDWSKEQSKCICIIRQDPIKLEEDILKRLDYA